LPIILFDQVSLEIKGQLILDSISFAAEQGDIIGLAGPSGSGKTSLLRLMNLMRSPTQGLILYKNRNLTQFDPIRLRRQVGYVMQKPYLFDGTVQENLAYAYQVWGLAPDTPEILSYLDRVNLPTAILDKTKNEMSGGEQQRVALIRSLLAKPKVLLLDEVTASLDEENTILLEQTILAERTAQSLTVFFISHQSEQLRRLASTVLYMKKGQLGFCGPKEDFFKRQEALNHE
jgi:putative ABC transport system ATP-binding protein